MKNDVPWVLPGRIRPDSKRQTFGVLDAIARSQELTKTQQERLQSSYQSTSEFIAASSELGHLVRELYAQGSAALGTLVRPIGKSGYDVDSVSRMTAAAYYQYRVPGGAMRLLDDHHKVLKRYGERHNLIVRRKARCIQIEYADDLHADITPLIDAPLYSVPYGEHHGIVTDRDLQAFYPSNPKGYRYWFDAVAEMRPQFRGTVIESRGVTYDAADIVPLPDPDKVYPRFLCRLIQVAKLHRNAAFRQNPDLAPTSIFITTLIAKAYAELAVQEHDDELDLYLKVIQGMNRQFAQRTLGSGALEWILLNPTTQHENIASRMNRPDRQQAYLQWQAKFYEDVCQLALQIENHGGGDARSMLVRDSFGDDAARRLQQMTQQQIIALRSQNKAVLLTPAATAVVLPSRAHAFHGDP